MAYSGGSALHAEESDTVGGWLAAVINKMANKFKLSS
jgi:hypothetical protein